MKEWYDQRRIIISALEVKFLIQLLEERIKLSTERIDLSESKLKEETDQERRKQLEDTIAKERRVLIAAKGFLRRFRGVLTGRKKRLSEIEAVVCHSLIS